MRIDSWSGVAQGERQARSGARGLQREQLQALRLAAMQAHTEAELAKAEESEELSEKIAAKEAELAKLTLELDDKVRFRKGGEGGEGRRGGGGGGGGGRGPRDPTPFGWLLRGCQGTPKMGPLGSPGMPWGPGNPGYSRDTPRYPGVPGRLVAVTGRVVTEAVNFESPFAEGSRLKQSTMPAFASDPVGETVNFSIFGMGCYSGLFLGPSRIQLEE